MEGMEGIPMKSMASSGLIFDRSSLIAEHLSLVKDLSYFAFKIIVEMRFLDMELWLKEISQERTLNRCTSWISMRDPPTFGTVYT